MTKAIPKINAEKIILDVDISSLCNAECYFCPRDDLPEFANMQQGTFTAVLERAGELAQKPTIVFCGTGDATMNPELTEFIDQGKKSGYKMGLTTNGILVDKKMSESLVNNGLDFIYFSVSGMGKTYEATYGAPFDKVVSNILEFKNISNGQCKIIITVIKDIFSERNFKDMRRFWRSLGIEFVPFSYTNRAGLLKNIVKKYVRISEEFEQECMCPTPFISIHVGPRGEYFLCSQDFSRRVAFGDVMTHSIKQSLQKKIDYLSAHNEICSGCNIYAYNYFDGSLPEGLLDSNNKKIIKLVNEEI